MCDKLLMTEGSGLYLAGPALVKAAIGQTTSHEELGGAAMHAAVSGTIDFREPDEDHCIERLRRLIDAWPADTNRVNLKARSGEFRRPPEKIVAGNEYDVHDLLAGLLDAAPFDEYKAEYGQTMVCGYSRLGGVPIGVVSNQKKRSKTTQGALQYGGVIYVDSADKAARFIMDCNQSRTPILFI